MFVKGVEQLQLLYGEGDRQARDQAYAEAMEKIYREYPDDLEAAAFYALALLGSVQPQDPAALQTRMRAGAIAMEAYRKEPNHAGAAHYILHAFDDPNHAILALPPAQRYAEIAPDAPHALHMPSHIFLQLGMWEEAAKSNEASWAASKKWVEQNNLSIAKHDYHSLHWLIYTYLQQGRHDDAEALLKLMQASLAEGPKNDPMFQGYGAFIYASMASAFVIETERWELAEKLFAPLQKNVQLRSAAEKPGPFQALAKYVQALAIFTPGFSAAKQGSPDAQKGITELQAMRKQAGKEAVPALGMTLSDLLEIQRLEVAAAASAAKGDLAEAIKTMQKATAVEASIEPPPGPPPLIKPANELLGEILLLAKRPKEAGEQFEIALLWHKNRAHALIGAARASERSGNREDAADAYAEFVDQWQGDPSILGEARDYLKQSGAMVNR
jgi:tetratricopeptide (TPR) repeat protein